ncbi:MAG: DUF3137 domain-containing protein [Clostridiales bacterium]|nr:DUF3137 domain-containing protein [Clostridiales bacterium]
MPIDAKAAGTRLTDNELSEKLSALHKKQMLFIVLGLIPLCLSFLCLAFSVAKDDVVLFFYRPMFFPFIIAAIFLFIMAAFQWVQIKELIGSNALQSVLDEIFELPEYNGLKHIDEKTMAATQLVPGWNTCRGNDYVSGIYRGVGLAFSNIQLTHVRGGDNQSTQKVPLFQGQWISCGLGREPGIHMIIRERPYKTMARWREKTRYELITGNAAFDERFQVITTDPDLARRFLTPRTLERIVSAAAMANARIFLYIGGKWLHVAVDSRKELFEVGKGAELADVRQLRARLKSEVRHITGIVDELLKIEYLSGR